jgi:Leucine-rich repeat (LRR) protein
MYKLRTLLICLFIFYTHHLNGQDTNNVVIYKASKSYYRPQVILDLSYKNLRDLPSEASNTEIEILILDNNMIEKLPNRIGNLKNLKILSVRNNNLNDLNSVLCFCPQLEQIYLS